MRPLLLRRDDAFVRMVCHAVVGSAMPPKMAATVVVDYKPLRDYTAKRLVDIAVLAAIVFVLGAGWAQASCLLLLAVAFAWEMRWWWRFAKLVRMHAGMVSDFTLAAERLEEQREIEETT